MKVKHLLLILIVSIAIGEVSIVTNANSAHASSYQTQTITKQDVDDMVNFGADYGLEEDLNMKNKSGINSTLISSGTKLSQNSGNFEYFQNFIKDSDIGMKYANKCLDYVSSNDYDEVIKNADIAIPYLTRAIQNLKKDTDQRDNAEKEKAIEDCTYVLAILYSEKARGEIEYINRVSSGKNNLENAININPDVAADTINSLARKAIKNQKYDAALIYIDIVMNSSKVSSSKKITARKLKTLFP